MKSIEVSLIIWAACPPLFIYGIFRRIERLQYVTALLFFLLLIDVMIGINTPNPDNFILVRVAVP